ncbi:hypothetical protein Acr_05g0000760 [Actinidia rufa]|uniref:Uncharacterized protein n=1 Tax=Actinidia rufa TaxID=165716 RepID=A0A7J0ELD4_9ERIC|nr:hypothetical protein Acr_05g0000760 [Actinidia rufa]
MTLARGRHRSASLHFRRARSPVVFESRSSSRTQDMLDEETKRRGRLPCRDDRAPKRRDNSTTQKIKDLDVRVDAINIGTNALIIVGALIRQTELSFTER